MTSEYNVVAASERRSPWSSRKRRTASWRAYLSEWVSDVELAQRIREAFTAGYATEDVADMAGVGPETVTRLAQVQQS